MIDYREIITSNPNVMLGKPCIKGTRITVELILEKLSDGLSIEQILKSYPHLNSVGIMGCLAYASDVIANEEILKTDK